MVQEYDVATDRNHERFESVMIIHTGRNGTGDGTESAPTADNGSKYANRFVVAAWQSGPSRVRLYVCKAGVRGSIPLVSTTLNSGNSHMMIHLFDQWHRVFSGLV
jgi:hypothetical protein